MVLIMIFSIFVDHIQFYDTNEFELENYRSIIQMELISKYGYEGELHRVTTSDGYILQLHRIKGRANSTNVQKPVAFVMHGLLCDSSVWVISGRERSLGKKNITLMLNRFNF